MGASTALAGDEFDLIVQFAGCTLDEKPGTNWVQEAGGLPDYICQIAKDIHEERGKTVAQAIAIAVSRVKKWATGVGVNKDTQAKASAALAEWEKLRAKSRAKTAAKKAAKVAASRSDLHVLNLSDYNMDDIRTAFQNRNNEVIREWRLQHPNTSYDDPNTPPYLYVKEVWNSFLIVTGGYDSDADLYKVPYTVDDQGEVTFDDPIPVRTEYVPTDETGEDDPGAVFTDDLLKKVLGMSRTTALNRVVTLSRSPVSSLSKVLAFAAASNTKDYANTKAGKYADPGYQADGKKRYALDTEEQCRAAWSYINQKDNAAKYSSADLSKVKAAIKTAAKKFGIQIADE